MSEGMASYKQSLDDCCVAVVRLFTKVSKRAVIVELLSQDVESMTNLQLCRYLVELVDKVTIVFVFVAVVRCRCWLFSRVSW